MSIATGRVSDLEFDVQIFARHVAHGTPDQMSQASSAPLATPFVGDGHGQEAVLPLDGPSPAEAGVEGGLGHPRLEIGQHGAPGGSQSIMCYAICQRI
jgi:hypothetical protein